MAPRYTQPVAINVDNSKYLMPYKAKLITIVIGLSVAVASRAPLWIVPEQDRYSMSIALALSGLVGSLLGGIAALVALIRVLVQLSRAL